MSPLDIVRIPAFNDNYIWLLRDRSSGKTAVVDPGDAGPVLAALEAQEWGLDYILCTHHHADHVGGNLELKQATGCTVVGSAADAARIPGLDVGLNEGDIFALGDATARVLSVSGHTVGHIAYAFVDARALFCGDTLFSLGCGRMFEGTAPVFWDSLAKLRALPDDMAVYCAHEYTQSNYRFAIAVDPDNVVLQALGAEITALRAKDEPTVPSFLGDEKRANPFLRADDPALAAALGLSGAAPEAVFADLRKRKDTF